MKERFLRVAALAVAVLVFDKPSTVGAVDDHLRCHKIRDPLARAAYIADLSVPPEFGCKIKVPGQLLCVGSEKINVMPSPPGAPPAAAAGAFVCYKVKCPKVVLVPITVSDQFGTRSVRPSAPTLVCAPQPTT